MNKQSVPRKDSTRGASVARKLIANTSIAQHILNSTIKDENVPASIQFCRATNPMLCGQVVLLPGQGFYLVASRFTARYYVVTCHKGVWQCSSRDSAVAAQCVAKVQAHRQAKQAA